MKFNDRVRSPNMAPYIGSLRVALSLVLHDGGSPQHFLQKPSWSVSKTRQPAIPEETLMIRFELWSPKVKIFIACAIGPTF